MRRETQWAQDALDAAARIRNDTGSTDLKAYRNDRLRQDAVERCFIIIAETLARLRVHAPEPAERIPRLRQIIDFRNLLAHEYNRVQPERVWKSIQQDLPELDLALRTLLAMEHPKAARDG